MSSEINRHNKDRDQITESKGNVFADLGFKRPDEERVKAGLVQEIRKIVQQRRLTQVQAANLLGVNQPKVSALMRGNLVGFSTDRLIRFLKALDCDIDIVIKPKPARRPARVQVRAA
jgi:predicted XRE-type DNA-binding protein